MDCINWFSGVETTLHNWSKSHLVVMYGGGGDLIAKSCLTPVTPWTVAWQAPLPRGFSRQEYWSGLPFLSSGYLPELGIEPASPMSPALAEGFFYHWATCEAFTATRKAVTKKTDHKKCWQGCGEGATYTYYWHDCKMVKLFGKQFGGSSNC